MQQDGHVTDTNQPTPPTLITQKMSLTKCSFLKYSRFTTYLTTSTALALTFGSLPVTDTLAVKEPSILNTTHSVFGGTMANEKSTVV